MSNVYFEKKDLCLFKFQLVSSGFFFLAGPNLTGTFPEADPASGSALPKLPDVLTAPTNKVRLPASGFRQG